MFSVNINNATEKMSSINKKHMNHPTSFICNVIDINLRKVHGNIIYVVNVTMSARFYQ